MYVLALSDYKQLAAAAGYKPAPQLGRQIVWIIIVMIFYFSKKYRIRVSQRKFGSQNLYRDEKTIFLFD